MHMRCYNCNADHYIVHPSEAMGDWAYDSTGRHYEPSSNAGQVSDE